MDDNILLDVSYEREGSAPVLKLYYPGQDGRDKDIKEIKDFFPYFYAVPRNDASALKRGIESEISSLRDAEEVVLEDSSQKLRVIKVTLNNPGEVPDAREKIRRLQECLETREDDIRFTQRYVINSGIVPMKGATNTKLKIAAFDIETVKIDSDGPMENTNMRPIIISYADSLGARHVWQFGNESSHKFAKTCSTEEEIIELFISTVKKQGIDIIVTYNGDNFDFPVIKDRCKFLGTKFNLGPKDEEVRLERRGMNLAARIPGRPHIDLYPICRKLFSLPRYTLEDVHEALFGEVKLDIEIENLASWWKEGKNIDKIIEYSISDVDSCLAIAKEVLPTEYELTQIVKQPIFEVSRMGSGNAIEWLLMSIAHEKGILVPNKPSDRDYQIRRGEGYEGAYVVEPIKGLHDNIFVFDFRSLYPSIIIAHNIDPSTHDQKADDALCSISPTGAKFKKTPKGLIPGLLNEILSSRTKIKRQLKKAKEEKESATTIKVLDARQQALKILANSAYGYMGFSRARWYDNDCAGSTAAWGREYIKDTIKKAEGLGYKVVYGDTDSLMLTVPGKITKAKGKDIAKDFLKEINSKLPEAMELEFEGFFPRGVFITKKRYALISAEGKLTIKGLETRRRDWAQIAKDTQVQVLDAILRERNPEKAAELVKKVILDLKEGNVPLSELLIHTQLTKPIGEYENKGPHVMAATKAQKKGMRIKPGDVLQYIITKKGNSISDKACLIGFCKENDYDPEYYINNQVLPAVMRVLEALGYNEDELKGLGKQTTLGHF